MYKHKYEKYKAKYLNLKKMYGGEIYSDDEGGDVDVENILDSEPDVEINLNDTIDVVIDENDKTNVLHTEKVVDYMPLEPFELISAKWIDNTIIDNHKFTKIDEHHSKKKYLKINTLDEFDIFTDKYGEIYTFTDSNPTYGSQEVLRILWNLVAEKYKGIIINHGLAEDRFETAFYKDKYYPSWWKNELKFIDNGILKFNPNK